MKKCFLFLGVVALTFTWVVDGWAAERSQTLKVYNWADYIDMDNVLDKFPAWYKEQTGEDIEVV
jgi:spermidine/putrescine transport system substrate-binding protein